METIIYQSTLTINLSIFACGDQIVKVTLGDSKRDFICQISNSSKHLAHSIHKWLELYLNHKCPPPSLPLKLDKTPTFSMSVLEILAKQPVGSLLSYKSLAELSKSPKAYRAVGTICKNNPIPLFIPCHRVIGSNSLGGFRYGLKIKKKLLAFEGSKSLTFR